MMNQMFAIGALKLSVMISLISMTSAVDDCCQGTLPTDMSHYFATDGPINAVKEDQVGTIDVERGMYVEFDLVVNSYSAGSWLSILHIGNSDKLRLPAFWLEPNNIRLHTRMSDADDWNRGYGPWVDLTIGTSYNIIVTVCDGTVRHYIDNNLIFQRTGLVTTTGNNQAIWISDPWYSAADVTLSNILIKSCTNLWDTLPEGACYDSYSCRGVDIESESIDCKGMRGCYEATGLVSTNGDIHCDGFEACYGAKNGISATNGHIYCDGERSCYQVNGDITTNNYDKSVLCNGEQSCSDTSIVSLWTIVCYGRISCVASSLQEARRVSCAGDLSCYNSAITGNVFYVNCNGRSACFGSHITAKEEIYCGSDSSCESTNMVITSSRSIVWCQGSASCGRATLDVSGSVYAYGRYALLSSNLIVASGKTMQLRAYGFWAGRWTDITCQDGATCNIHCSGNGCHEMDVYCQANAVCNIDCYGFGCYAMNVHCDTSATCNYQCGSQGIYCPNKIITTLSLLTQDDAIYKKKQERYEIKEKYKNKINKLMTQYNEIKDNEEQHKIMEQIKNMDSQMESELDSLYNKYNNNNNDKHNSNNNKFNNKLIISKNGDNFSVFETIVTFMGVFVAPLLFLYIVYTHCSSHCSNKDKYQDYQLL